jgi:hypothetical protein
MGTKIKYCILLLALPLLFKSCIEPYRPELGESQSEYILVVEGLITNEPGSFKVSLSRSVPVDTTVNYLPETGAYVAISDDVGNLYELFETTPGNYKCADEEVRAHSDRKYQLIITDSDGKNYESALVQMEPTPDIKQVFWNEITKNVFDENEVHERKGIDISVESEKGGESKYYKWDFVETWKIVMPDYVIVSGENGPPVQVLVNLPPEQQHCWVTWTSNNILLKSFAGQETGKVDSFLVTHIPENNQRLHYRYSIEVGQYCLDQEMYNFWKSIKEFNEDIGSMYDHIPNAVYGNITCCSDENIKVLGYFDAAEVKTNRIFIDKNELQMPTVNVYEDCIYGFRPNDYPFASGIYALSPFCVDCRNYGTSVKPDFWDQ